ncbi:MAG: hypothetical protein ACK5OB_09645 [Pirellula sp.]
MASETKEPLDGHDQETRDEEAAIGPPRIAGCPRFRFIALDAIR